jgi:aminocarboxymuconate-semialdehyde decarboxylase
MSPAGEPTGAVIDIHAHVMSMDAQELTRPHFTRDKDPFFHFSSAATDASNKRLMAEITPKLSVAEVRLRDMDRMGVDVQAISVAPPQYFYWTEPDLGVRLARLQNDNLAGMVRAHPDRFVGLGTLPLQDVDASLAELDRMAGDLGFTGIEICTSVNGSDLDHPRFEPLFRRAEELDVLIVMHPNGFSHGERLADYYLINTVGMPLDSTVSVARLIFGGVLERHPDLKIVVVHGGGYLPFYPARFDHAYRMREDCREHITRPPSTYLAQLHFDTMVFDPDDLALLIARYGADHVLLGSDYPYDMGDPDPVALVSGLDRLDDKERALVMGGNAARLLKLDR